jgi:RNA polymerase sigma-70 factor, ECF subfamily
MWQSFPRHVRIYGSVLQKVSQGPVVFPANRNSSVSVVKTSIVEFEQAELAALLRRSAAGERQAFASLYEKTAPKLFGLLRRMFRSEEIARDALQETYVLIWKNASSYNPGLAAPLTWMARIARNKAIDIRRLRSERIASLSDELDLKMLATEENASDAKRDELRRLENCLQGLSVERRNMILLAYCNGLSREELSQRFSRPVNTVKTVLRRGLAELKECLGDDD